MRKVTAIILLLVFMFAYIIAVASIGSRLATAHGGLQLLFYVVAGFLWLLPIRPLFRWMNSAPAGEQDH